MDQHHIGLCFLQNVFNTQQNICGDGGQGLTGTHDVQVIIGLYIENLSDLIQHLTVLAGEADDALNIGILLQLLYQRAHFDCLGTGAENAHNL